MDNSIYENKLLFQHAKEKMQSVCHHWSPVCSLSTQDHTKKFTLTLEAQKQKLINKRDRKQRTKKAAAKLMSLT